MIFYILDRILLCQIMLQDASLRHPVYPTQLHFFLPCVSPCTRPLHGAHTVPTYVPQGGYHGNVVKTLADRSFFAAHPVLVSEKMCCTELSMRQCHRVAHGVDWKVKKKKSTFCVSAVNKLDQHIWMVASAIKKS